MKLTLLLALPFALALVPRAEHSAVEPEHRRPIGFGTPIWHWSTPDPALRETRGLPELPTAVVERLESFEHVHYEATWLGQCFTPTGLELWILGQRCKPGIGPDFWHCFLRDPRTGTLTPQSIMLDNTMLGREKPRVRFIDLDDDGHDELAFRQFEHNGTMVNNDLELYYRVGDDLSLDRCLVQRIEILDLYSKGESGSVRSRLMRTDSGGLEADVWRENPGYGVPRVPIGTLRFGRGADGAFEVIASNSLLLDDEREQRYDFAIRYAFDESINSGTGRERLPAWVDLR